MKNIDKELEKIISRLEKLGRENDYTLHAKEENVEKLKNILENIFCE